MQLRLAAPPTGPKPRNRVLCDSVPGRPRPLERLKPRAAGSAPKHRTSGAADCALLRARRAQGQLGAHFPGTKLLASVLTPESQARAARLVGRRRAQGTKYIRNPKRLDSPAARARVPSQSGRSRCLRVPRTKLLEWLINGLIDCQGPHLQNSEECDPGREKSETNPSNHPLPLHRQDTSRNNLTGLKPGEDFFFLFFFFLSP